MIEDSIRRNTGKKVTQPNRRKINTIRDAKKKRKGVKCWGDQKNK